MDRLPTVKEPEIMPATLQDEVEAARAFATEQHSPATRRAYESDFRIFDQWCRARGARSLPAGPEVVAVFLGSQAKQGVKASTLSRRTAAIRYFHSLKKLEPPTNSEIVKATLKGIRRSIGVAREKKSPATVERILAMVDHVPDTPKGLRDRALLLLGFAGAFRRSELAAIQVEDLEEVEERLRVHVRQSKTDQEAAGQVVAIIRGSRACPVEAVNAWLEAAGIETGPIFRRVRKGGRVMDQALSTHSVGAIVKAYAAKAGYNPDEFAGHSLRAVFLTSAASRGASIFRMMDVSRHKSVDTVRGYVRQAEKFKDHAGEGLL